MVLHAAGRKKKRKKNTLSTRGCPFFGTLSTRGRYYMHAPHTEHEGEYLFGSDMMSTEKKNPPILAATENKKPP